MLYDPWHSQTKDAIDVDWARRGGARPCVPTKRRISHERKHNGPKGLNQEFILNPMDAVIFDMDGLLIDSEPLWEKAEADFLLAHNRKFSHEIACRTTGLRLDELIPAMKKYYDFEGEDVSLGREIISHLFRHFEKGIPVLPGAQQALASLHGTLPLALASSSSRRVINHVLDLNDWHRYFNIVCSGEEVRKGKPAPDVFLLAANRLGVAPSRCVVFEDSLNGVKAAKAAGMRCIAIPCASRFQDSEFEGLADRIIPSLEFLPADLFA